MRRALEMWKQSQKVLTRDFPRWVEVVDKVVEIRKKQHAKGGYTNAYWSVPFVCFQFQISGDREQLTSGNQESSKEASEATSPLILVNNQWVSPRCPRTKRWTRELTGLQRRDDTVMGVPPRWRVSRKIPSFEMDELAPLTWWKYDRTDCQIPLSIDIMLIGIHRGSSIHHCPNSVVTWCPCPSAMSVGV